MPTQVHELQTQVLCLPPEDRARMLELLIASFEPRHKVQAAWLDVAVRRREDVRSGETAMVPGSAALARVKARLA